MTRKPWEAQQEGWKVAKRMRLPRGLKGTKGSGQTSMHGARQLTLTTPVRER